METEQDAQKNYKFIVQKAAKKWKNGSAGDQPARRFFEKEKRGKMKKTIASDTASIAGGY